MMIRVVSLVNDAVARFAGEVHEGNKDLAAASEFAEETFWLWSRRICVSSVPILSPQIGRGTQPK